MTHIGQVVYIHKIKIDVLQPGAALEHITYVGHIIRFERPTEYFKVDHIAHA